jgi:hypothetical protein
VERVLPRPNVGGHTCLQLRTDYDTDARTLAKVVKMSEQALLEVSKGKQLSPTSAARISGYSEVTVDPATMLLYSQSSARTVTMRGAKSQPVGAGTERHSYTFAYAK